MAQFRIQRGVNGLIVLIASILLIAVLYAASAVFIPLALAMLLSFLLAPLVVLLQRTGLGRVASVIVVTVLSFLAIGLVGWIVAEQAVDLARKLPEYQDNIREKVQMLQSSANSILGRAAKSLREIAHEERHPATPAPQGPGALTTTPPHTGAEQGAATKPTPVPVEIVERPSKPIESIATFVTPLLRPLASAAIVAVFVIFMLIQREDLRDRLIQVIGRGRLTVTTVVLDDATTRISRYLFMLMLVNVAYGVVIAVGLLLIGIPNALLWGVLASLLRFIPYVGAWISALMPIIVALAVFNSWVPPLLAAGLFTVVELLVANFVEPWLYGSQTGLSPIAVLAAAVFWAWLWGPIGLVLAMPLTLCLVVIGHHVPQLAFLSVLLGDQPSLPIPVRVYQRLLAMDQDEAYELAAEYVEQHSLLAFYDRVLLRSLALAEHDRHRGDLSPEQERLVYKSMRDLIAHLAEQQKAAAPPPAAGAPPTEQPPAKEEALAEKILILCLPARSEADEIASLMLAQVLETQDFSVEVISHGLPKDDLLAMIEQRKTAFICISAMPPLAATHARALCRRLSARWPDLQIIIGLWTMRDRTRAEDRLKSCATAHLVGAFSEMLDLLQEGRTPQPAAKTKG